MAAENKSIDEEKLRAAKEKLSCRILPPGSRASHTDATPSPEVSSCTPLSYNVNKTADKIRLTEMTSAGG